MGHSNLGNNTMKEEQHQEVPKNDYFSSLLFSDEMMKFHDEEVVESSEVVGGIDDTKYWDFDFVSEDYCCDEQQQQQLVEEINNDDDDDECEEESYKASLNLSLNYQHVLDEWSDRRTLWAHDEDDNNNATLSLSNNPNNAYMGEVPVMDEEERTTRREASVMRYKEKRNTRLFSKKIRYQVRKLNADKRPRLKGRFVRKVPDED